LQDAQLKKALDAAGVPDGQDIVAGGGHGNFPRADADKAMVQQLGQEIRWHAHFAPKGTNVNFVQVLEKGRIRVRTYERGVEGETLACGTGVTASALESANLISSKKNRWVLRPFSR